MSGDRRVDLGNFWYGEKDFLGAGAFGEVYKCHSHKARNELFAVKKVRAENIDKREIQILQELSAPGVAHSNLVKLMDYIHHADGIYVYLVLEYCNGGDLAGYLKEKKTLNEPSLRIVLQQIAAGMKVLHDHRVIHRDLKPENILLCHNGGRDISDITFKIADFGIGRFLDAGMMAGTICGTPVFMAPELFNRRAQYDYKVDLWSIGAIAYVCFTGRLPYDALPGIPGVFGAFDSAAPIRYPSIISSSLKDLLSRLLCVSAAKRISFSEFYNHPFIGIGEPPKKVDVGKVISIPVVPIPTNQDYKPSPQERNVKVVVQNSPEVFKPAPILKADIVVKGSSDKENTPQAQAKYARAIRNKPPEAFRIVQIQEKDIAVRPCSSPARPQPYKDISVFQHVDAHALEVSKARHDSFRDLLWNLIFAREINDELEKARALFVWLCCQDFTRLSFSNVQENSPEEILMKVQHNRISLPDVFVLLCSYAGLQCRVINGYAKGNSFRIGVKLSGDQGKHTWNAVYVNGSWQLVDCTWAARKLADKNISATNISDELNGSYFMSDPRQFIFTHFPDDSIWQLLDSPVTRTDFETQPLVTPTFFKFGLNIISHRRAVIHAKQEERIRIGCPLLKTHPVAFAYVLTSEDGKEEFKGIKLHRFVMHEMTDSESVFTVRLPEKGIYRFSIYAKQSDKQASSQGSYVNVCQYQLQCDADPVRTQPFPPGTHTSWGPRDIVAKYDLNSLQRGSLVHTVNGVAEIRLQTSRYLRFSAKLKSNDKDEKALEGFLVHRTIRDLAVFTVMAPHRGEFALEIWVGDPELDGNSLHHAYQYLVVCSEEVPTVVRFPVLAGGYLGPQQTFRKLGLSLMSHEDPYVKTDHSEIRIDFRTKEPTCLSSKLLYSDGNSDEDASQFVLQQTRGNDISLLLRLPKPGFYKLQVYANLRSVDDPNLPGIYNYLIRSTGKPVPSSGIPFPEQSGRWKQGCYLHEPMDGRLQRNHPVVSRGGASTAHHVYFRVEVPKATQVAVVTAEKDWTRLDQRPSGAWEGEVDMEKHWGHNSDVVVCAKYGDSKDSHTVLLTYSV